MVKGMVAEALRSRYEGIDSACVIDMTGMAVQQQQKLRFAIREKRGRIQVVKNSMARRAFRGGPLEALSDALSGPCALVVAEDSLIEVAKALAEAAKEFSELKLKHAVLEGDPDLISVELLSTMKTKRETIGELAMLIASPGRTIAACLQSPQAKVAGCLKAMADRAA